MKRFDYFCLLYSVALLVFGFDDKTPQAKANAAKPQKTIQVQTIANVQPAIVEQVIARKTPPLTNQAIKRVRFTK